MAKPVLSFRGVGVSSVLQSMAKAFVQTFPAGTTCVIDGVTYTCAQLAAAFLEDVALFDAAEAARQAFIFALAARDQRIPGIRARLAGSVSMLETMYGKDTASFARFGVPARKAPRPLTTEEKLAAQAKSRATRVLRNTMGRRQKEKIKAQGDATVEVTLAPVDSTPKKTA
jgi:hypothetical protein